MGLPASGLLATGLLAGGEIRVVVTARGATEAEDRTLHELLAREASGNPVLTLSRRCAVCGSHAHGAPTVDAPGLFVSLSRAGGLVAFALSAAPVGVDIESVAAVARRDIDSVAFTSKERERLASSGRADLLRAELWAGKEAVLKLRGTGLRVEPSSFELAKSRETRHPFAPGSGLVGVAAGTGRLTLILDRAGHGTEIGTDP